MILKLVGRALVVGWLLAAAGLPLVGAQETPPAAPSLTLERLDVGFNGLYKVGDWTPLWVTVRVSAPLMARLVIETPDPDDEWTILPGTEQPLSPGDSAQLRGYFKTGRLIGELRVRIESDGRVVAQRTFRADADGDTPLRPALRQSSALWVTLGHPAGFESAAAKFVGSESEVIGGAPSRAYAAPLDEPRQLPEEGFAYQGVDAIGIAASARGPNGDLLISSISAIQDQALREWVWSGGHLILSLGAELDAYRRSRFAKWVPIPVEGESQLRQLDGLVTYIARPAPIRFDGTVPAARLGETAGTVLARELDGPLLVQAPYGFGRITMLAVDLDRPPLSNWNAAYALCAKLLAQEQAVGRNTANTGPRPLNNLGVTDLATQLQFAQDQFPSVDRFSLWGVMGLLLLYILVIGPVDYYVVNRWLGRPQLTWITFPLLVLAAAAGSVVYANWSNGTGLQINQVDVVDIDAASRQVRGRTWVTLYSPATRRYQVEVKPQTQAWTGAAQPASTASRITWNGVPENGIGGMYRASGVQLTERSYRYRDKGQELADLPISVWSTKNVTAEWREPPVPESESPLIESALESEGVGRLSGTVSHRLPFPLEDCLLAYGNRVYFPMQRVRGQRVPILAPLQSWDIGRQFAGEQRELRGYLTKVLSKKIGKESPMGMQIQMLQTPYNPLSRDRTDILRMLTLHQAAGGSAYTGLRQDTLPGFDFSTHLRLGRAVLFGRLQTPDPAAAQLVLDGAAARPAESFVYVRCLLPVKRIEVPELNDLPDPNEGIERPR